MQCNRCKFSRILLFLLFFITLFSLPDVNAQAQGSLVKGAVHAANNEPLSGVSVVIRNARTNFTTGTTTDSSGKFHLFQAVFGRPIQPDLFDGRF